MSALLEVNDLRAGYGRAEVLQGLSFSAAENSVVTVIGPNGAGKSTLLGALMGQPKLLMLDEPSLGLAPLIVREIFAIVDDLRASGVSILLVEQNARAALRVADHGHVLETGEFGLSGPAAALAADPRVIETYLGAGGAH